MKAYFLKFLVQTYHCVPDTISSLEILQWETNYMTLEYGKIGR